MMTGQECSDLSSPIVLLLVRSAEKHEESNLTSLTVVIEPKSRPKIVRISTKAYILKYSRKEALITRCSKLPSIAVNILGACFVALPGSARDKNSL